MKLKTRLSFYLGPTPSQEPQKTGEESPEATLGALTQEKEEPPDRWSRHQFARDTISFPLFCLFVCFLVLSGGYSAH